MLFWPLRFFTALFAAVQAYYWTVYQPPDGWTLGVFFAALTIALSLRYELRYHDEVAAEAARKARKQ